MKIEDKRSGESLDAIIEQVATIDFAKIRKDKGFLFDWELEKENEVHKIFLLDKQESILGLMSLIDYPNTEFT